MPDPRSHPSTRQRIRAHLKAEGPADAEALAGVLGITAMAVRQHLYAMADEGLVAYDEVARPKGRPAKLWRLTEAADAYFPDGHAELTVGLIESLRVVFGEPGMAKLLTVRAGHQAADYAARMAGVTDLAARCRDLAAIRTEEGYMAAVEDDGADGLLLIENHCPVCAAARSCVGLCAMELDVFRQVLGDGATVERTDHIIAGARRCAYRIRATSSDG